MIALARSKELDLRSREDTIRSNPGVGVIDDTALLQFEGNAIENVIADVFFIRQNLMD